jgi:hypothetical protein
MLFAATHIVDVLTGTTTDDYGDPVPGTTVAAAAVPFSILEQTRRTSRLDTDTPRTVTTLTGRCLHGVPVTVGDRLRDTAGPTVWVVDEVAENANAVVSVGVRCTLRRLP